MPTGYTAPIYSGQEGYGFKHFALDCAKAFGACITMRDEPSGTPIPDAFEPSNYHLEKLEDAKKKLARIRKMEDDAKERGAKRYNEAALKHWVERVQKDKELKVRYEMILAEAKDWTPPTDEHQNFKKFMVSQLEESIKFDCDDDIEKPKPLTPKQWHKDQIEKAEWDVRYHSKEYAEEVKRCTERTAWVRDLRESLS